MKKSTQPCLLRRCDGISLLEVLLAAVLLVVVIISASLLFPRASQSHVQNRERIAAKSVALGYLDSLQKKSYDAIPLTTAFPPGITQCNCSQMTSASFAALAPNSTMDAATNLPMETNVVRNGLTYRSQVCIDQVSATNGGTWTHTCSNVDTGMKYIRIHVSWTSADTTVHAIDLESVATQA